MTAPTVDHADEGVDADPSQAATDTPGAGRATVEPVRSAWQGAAILTGLAGVAITQPVLDMLGRNPEFFVAGAYRPRQVVGFAQGGGIVAAGVALRTVAGGGPRGGRGGGPTGGLPRGGGSALVVLGRGTV